LERPSQPSPETRKAAQLAKAAYEAERAITLMQLRAEAHTRMASALSQLAMQYQGRAAGLRARFKGDELIAALAALHSEQKSAERALRTQLAAEARQRQRSVLRELQVRRRNKRTQLSNAGHAATNKDPPRRNRRRPQRQRKPRPKGPRARR
jgi:hypothetical protein